MGLEEKLSSLPPHLRDQVEVYVDFLLTRQGEELSGIPQEKEISTSVPETVPPVQSRFKIPGRTDNSGIIHAAERIEVKDEDGFEVIDFADINSRFGHDVSEKSEIPKRQQRMFDWL